MHYTFSLKRKPPVKSKCLTLSKISASKTKFAYFSSSFFSFFWKSAPSRSMAAAFILMGRFAFCNQKALEAKCYNKEWRRKYLSCKVSLLIDGINITDADNENKKAVLLFSSVINCILCIITVKKGQGHVVTVRNSPTSYQVFLTVLRNYNTSDVNENFKSHHMRRHLPCVTFVEAKFVIFIFYDLLHDWLQKKTLTQKVHSNKNPKMCNADQNFDLQILSIW